MTIREFMRGIEYSNSLVGKRMTNKIKFYDTKGIEHTLEECENQEISGASFYIDFVTHKPIMAISYWSN